MFERLAEFKLFAETLIEANLLPVQKRTILELMSPVYRREFNTDLAGHDKRIADRLRDEMADLQKLYKMRLDCEVSFFPDFSKMKYFQCDLSQNGSKMTAWIEERGASVGKRVKITDLEAEDKYWNVDNVYTPGMDEKAFKERQKNLRAWDNNI